MVDPGDPAFTQPTKPIGPVFDASEVERLASHTGWTFMPDGGGFRRSVPSPEPLRIRGTGVIQLLVRSSVVVICARGGGIPVVADHSGALHGVEAVIDKGLSAALLAQDIGADALLLLTDVPAVWAVWSQWPMVAGQAIDRITPAELRGLSLAAGSMGPRPKPPAASSSGPGASSPLTLWTMQRLSLMAMPEPSFAIDRARDARIGANIANLGVDFDLAA